MMVAESSLGWSNNVGGGCDAICGCGASPSYLRWRLSWAPATTPERAPGVPVQCAFVMTKQFGEFSEKNAKIDSHVN